MLARWQLTTLEEDGTYEIHMEVFIPFVTEPKDCVPQGSNFGLRRCCTLLDSTEKGLESCASHLSKWVNLAT
jgi:hypothetical protein